MIKFHIAFLWAACLILAGCVTAGDSRNIQVSYVPIEKIFATSGVFRPDEGQYWAELTISSLGGDFTLSVSGMSTTIEQGIRDITGIAWATTNHLLYSVSPIYGKPGIYILDCTTKETKRIISPVNFNIAYPNGADYFELHRLHTEKIYFYYTPDVDSINFKEFRSRLFLFQANLDGSEVEKADDSE